MFILLKVWFEEIIYMTKPYGKIVSMSYVNSNGCPRICHVVVVR